MGSTSNQLEPRAVHCVGKRCAQPLPVRQPQAEEESDDSSLDRTRAELDRAVDDLKRALSAIDPTAMEDLDGFWMTFLDDVQMGDFSI